MNPPSRRQRRDELRREVLSTIETIGRRQLRLEGPVDANAHLVRDLGLDSLRQLTLLIEIEDHFRVAFDDITDRRIVTVQDLVDAVVERLVSVGDVDPSTREGETES